MKRRTAEAMKPGPSARGGRPFRWAVAGCLLAVCAFASPAPAGDPYLRWSTLKTERFHIHYSDGLEFLAQDLASVAQRIEDRLEPALGYAPTAVTEVVLSDGSDSANGAATVRPYNLLKLFATAPDDMSTLNDYGNWPIGLFTHEETHILQLSNVSGLPAMLATVFGQRYMPNTLQPRWILEGLAVAQETRQTSGGRLRSTQFDMYLRADVVENNLAGLDVMTGDPWRWPGGAIAYLYGGAFVNFILDVYGAGVFAAVATAYGQNLIPWGLNRVIRQATGRDYPQLYAAWKRALEERYEKQLSEVKRQGLREGTRLTHLGRVGRYPRFQPTCGPGEEADNRRALVYFVNDGTRIPGIYRVPLKTPTQAGDLTLLERASGGYSTFLPNCQMLYESTAPFLQTYSFYELFLQAGRGFIQLTEGLRARYPDVSPDGTRIAYVTNKAATQTLKIADLSPAGAITGQRTLVPSGRYEQAYTPRFSPSGSKLAYSAWTTGGYRDIRIVDVASGQFVQLQHDRAIDQQPLWSPDGKTVYWVSDRSGIANIYAYDVESGHKRRVTNVRMGAYMPAISDDGQTLYYVGYTSKGFDLWALPLNSADWLDFPDNTQLRAAAETFPEFKPLPTEPYSAWGTIYPHSWGIEYGPDSFGNSIELSTGGGDAVGFHTYSLSATFHFDDAIPEARFHYAYHRLPFRMDLDIFAYADDREASLYGNEAQVFIERTTGATSSIRVPFPGIFHSQNLSLGYTAAKIDGAVPIDPEVEPYATLPSIPDHGHIGIVRLGYSFSSAIRPSLAISNEYGIELNLNLDIASEETASEWNLTAFSGRLRGYILAPWGDHQVFALALSAASAYGDYAREGFYRVGGFQKDRLLDDIASGVRQGPFVLRGYEPAQFFGRRYALLNSEYRVPVWYADQGLSTLPLFLRTVSVAAFADYGGAWTHIDAADPFEPFHLGVGGELRLQLLLAYFINTSVRLGYGYGLDNEALPEGEFYAVVAGDY